MALRIYLARHGQTDWNAEQRLQGWTDIALNEKGRDQALELRRRLSGFAFQCIYCSALLRSRQTAAILCEGVSVVALPELNEQSHGSFEGKCLDGSDAALLAEYQRRRSDPDDSLDGGESQNQHRNRIQNALNKIRANHPDEGEILIVGHGGTNSLILQLLTGSANDLMFRIRNTDIFAIELQDPPKFWKLSL